MVSSKKNRSDIGMLISLHRLSQKAGREQALPDVLVSDKLQFVDFE